MKALTRILPYAVALVLLLSAPPVSRASSQKPALIRDTGIAESRDIPEPEKPKEYNPLLARQNINVGNYYLKKKNYAAAIQRYLEAIEYQPNLTQAHEALAKAYEKNGEIARAAGVYREFIRQYPDSPKSADFKSKLAKLEKK